MQVYARIFIKYKINYAFFYFSFILYLMKRLFFILILLSTFTFSLAAESLFLYENNAASTIQLTAAKPNRPGYESEKSQKPNRPGSSDSRKNRDDDTTIGSIFFDILFEIFDQIWIFSHINADYDYAPYASRDSYIDFKSDEDDVDKFYRYTFETGLFFFPQDLTIGNESRIEGITYKFFGPVFENTIFTDLRTISNASRPWLQGNLRLGGQLNLVNFNVINIAFNLQWTHWYGLANIDGMCLGFTLRSYPIEPLLIEWRVNWQDYISVEKCNDFSAYFESHLELGFMTGKVSEVYAAWKYINDRYYGIRKNGFATGVKIHL